LVPILEYPRRRSMAAAGRRTSWSSTIEFGCFCVNFERTGQVEGGAELVTTPEVEELPPAARRRPARRALARLTSRFPALPLNVPVRSDPDRAQARGPGE